MDNLGWHLQLLRRLGLIFLEDTWRLVEGYRSGVGGGPARLGKLMSKALGLVGERR